MEGWKVVQRSRTKRYVQRGLPWSILSMSYYVETTGFFTPRFAQMVCRDTKNWDPGSQGTLA